MSEQEPKQSSLRTYLAVLRRRIFVLAGIVAVGAVVAATLAILKDESYTAESSVRFKDRNEVLGEVGLLPVQGELPAQISAQGAEAVSSPEVLERVIEKLDLRDTTVDELEGELEAAQEPQSNLVLISADASTSVGASSLANALARTTVKVLNEDVRDSFARRAEQLEQQASQIDVPGGDILDLGNEDRANLDALSRQRGELLELAAQYLAASTGAVVAEVATEATPPESPSNMSPITAAIVGGLLGLILSMIVIGVLESLDRRLHTTDAAEAAANRPLIGVVLDEGMGGVPVGDHPTDEQIAAMNSFQILRTNLSFLRVDDRPRTVLVTSALAEEGKTTVAQGLALAAAGRGRVLLVEADLHRPVHASRLGLAPSPGLSDYLSGDASPQDVLQRFDFTNPAQLLINGGEPGRSSLVCITAGSRTPWASELLGSQRFKDFLMKVRSAYDLVVVDSAPLLGVAETSQIVPLVDAIAFCVRLDQTTSEQARSAQEMLSRLPEKPTGLVVTGLRARDRGYYSYAYSYGVGQRPGATV